MENRTAREHLDRYDACKSQRQSFWDPLWQHCSDYIIPRKSQILSNKSPGVEDYTQDLYDTTMGDANSVLASGIMQGTAPATDRWFSFDPPAVLTQRRRLSTRAIEWYQSATSRVHIELARSNFYTELHEAHLERGAFATCALQTMEGRRFLYNFKAIEIGTYCIVQNDEGYVDTVYREFKLSLRNLVKMFGEESLPDRMRSIYRKAKKSDLDSENEVVHCVYPREDDEREYGRRDPANKPFASLYILREGCAVLRESGFDELPIAVSRFLAWPGEVWGYGPGIDALPVGRQANHIEKSMDALAELKAFPRSLIPANLEGQVDLRPAGVTVFDPNQPNALPREWMTQGDYDIGLERMKSKETKIRRAFFNDLFRMLADVEPGKATAYEISVRQQEKLSGFSPTFQRITTELYSPTLLRCFGIAYRAGMLEDAPPDVFVATADGVRLALPSVSYSGMLALMLKQVENRATMDAIATLAPIIQARPETLDVFDLDAVAIGVARNLNVPPAFVRDVEEVAAIRAERAEMQRQQMQLQAAQGAAKAAADLGRAPRQMQEAAAEALT